MKPTISGIKCDNKSCNYRDDSVSVSNYSNYVDRPCPTCGENLLTEKDYKIVQVMLRLQNNRFVKIVEFISGFFGAKERKINFDMNGTGQIKPQKETKR